MKVSQRIAAIESRPLAIPFRQVFRHASATRDETATLWVSASDDGALVGYGEGCPREYVTGESLQSAQEFVAQWRNSVITSVTDLDSLKAWISHHASDIDNNPTAWCAMELALLDLFSRQTGISVEDYLGLPPLGQVFEYTAVVGVTTAQQCSAMLAQYQQLGMTDYKIKLSGDLPTDRQNLDLLVATQPTRVRIDVNNLWSDLGAATDYLSKLNYPFFAIEEPFKPGRYDLMEALAEALDTRIILDESALRIQQVERISRNPERWIVNVRVSKMGGLLRSLNFVAQCRAHKINIIVGAQVGETSLLTRAGLTIASAARDILIAQEGAFGTYLLQTDPCEPELKFSRKGRLEVASYDFPARPGFGLRFAGHFSF